MVLRSPKGWTAPAEAEGHKHAKGLTNPMCGPRS
ncbi:MAG: hypothetical protein ACFCVA_05645 [Gammaproteobacteria bacterium]